MVVGHLRSREGQQRRQRGWQGQAVRRLRRQRVLQVVLRWEAEGGRQQRQGGQRLWQHRRLGHCKMRQLRLLGRRQRQRWWGRMGARVRPVQLLRGRRRLQGARGRCRTGQGRRVRWWRTVGIR